MTYSDSKVAASIVLYRTNLTVIRTINNVIHSNLNLHLYLIDNSPNNQFENENIDIVKHPLISYIHNNNNVGFGAGHNIAIKKSIHFAKYHVVINPDIYFGEGVLEALFQYMEQNQEVGHVMPKILYPNGDIQYVAKLLPSPFDLFIRRFLPAHLFKQKKDIFELKNFDHDSLFQAPYLSGCFMFLRIKAIAEVGLFDERFFMYPEDIDLTRRIHEKYKTIYYPYVHVFHEHGKGSYKSIKMLWIHTKNMINYFNKWGWFFDEKRKNINSMILTQFKS